MTSTEQAELLFLRAYADTNRRREKDQGIPLEERIDWLLAYEFKQAQDEVDKL